MKTKVYWIAGLIVIAVMGCTRNNSATQPTSPIPSTATLPTTKGSGSPGSTTSSSGPGVPVPDTQNEITSQNQAPASFVSGKETQFTSFEVQYAYDEQKKWSIRFSLSCPDLGLGDDNKNFYLKVRLYDKAQQSFLTDWTESFQGGFIQSVCQGGTMDSSWDIRDVNSVAKIIDAQESVVLLLSVESQSDLANPPDATHFVDLGKDCATQSGHFLSLADGVSGCKKIKSSPVSPPLFLDVAKGPDGKALHLLQSAAVRYCTDQGAHLPSVRELAQLAMSQGARGIVSGCANTLGPINPDDACKSVNSCYQIHARNADGSYDCFYYSSFGYKNPTGDLSNLWLWSSSIELSISNGEFIPQFPFHFYSDYGSIDDQNYLSDDAFNLYGVRCASGH